MTVSLAAQHSDAVRASGRAARRGNKQIQFVISRCFNWRWWAINNTMRFQHLPTLRSDLPTNVGFLWWFNTLKLAGHENTPSCPDRNLPHCNHQIDSDQSILSSGNAADTKKLPLTAGGTVVSSTEGIGWPSYGQLSILVSSCQRNWFINISITRL